MNSSAWDKFRKQQATAREPLQRLLSGIHGLLAKCRTTAPTEIELSALAPLIHSFYTGVENIFKRVAVELDGEPVRGDSWHRELLPRMKSPTAHRPVLLTPVHYADLASLSIRIGRRIGLKHFPARHP